VGQMTFENHRPIGRAIAKRPLEGETPVKIANEFGTTADLVRQAIRRVGDYDRGTQCSAKIRSIDVLDLTGGLPLHARSSLTARRITRIKDLAGISITEMLT